MKKYLLFITAVLGINTIQAQEIGVADAVRYAQDNMNGTARFRAMSGAFGALGGDLSAINVNPAGSVIFANSVVGITATSYNPTNHSRYFGSTESDDYNAFDLNQAGGVYVFRNPDRSSNWKKFAIAVNYDTTNNFDNSLFVSGTNPTSSIDSYFLSFANQNGGIALSNLRLLDGETIDDLYQYLGETNGLGFEAQQAFLGYQGYVINPVNDSDANTQYTSNVAAGNFYHEFQKETRGYNGKLTLNFAAQYGDRWHFGFNINTHFTDYYQWTSLYESNDNNTTAGLQRLRFNNELNSTGSGVSAQLGTIVKITQSLRAGVAYESPTWLWINDKLTQSLTSVTSDTQGELPSVYVDPRVVNVYETYRHRSPGKWTGSLAYIFGQYGLLSVDYSLRDYGNTRFGGDGDFSAVNRDISNQLDIAGELHVGAEYRIKKFSIRGGYRNEQSPYKNKATMGDLNGFSGGLGYNFGKTKLDLAYNYWQRDYQQQFVVTGLTDAATVTTKNNNVSLSLMFDL
jgi:hypothetical protein